MANEAELHHFFPQLPPEAISRIGALVPATMSAEEEAALLRLWESDIRRAAVARANAIDDSDQADDFAQEARLQLIRAARQIGSAPVHYMRRVVRNAVLDCARRELLTVRTISLDAGDDNEKPDPPAPQPDSRVIAVRDWVTTLSARLRQVYELLYVKGFSQREAAGLLGVSQPRITQLHHKLLSSGRVEFADLAA